MLRLMTQDSTNPKFFDYKFIKRNINKIAKNYDCKVIKYEEDIKHALLKDNYDRLIWVDAVRASKCRTCGHIIQIN